MFTELTRAEQTKLYFTLRDSHKKFERLMKFLVPAQVSEEIWRSVADADWEMLEVMSELSATPYADSRP